MLIPQVRRTPRVLHSHAVEEVVALRLLVDDGVDADSGLTRLTVTDHQLTLSASDGDQSVYGLEAGLRGTHICTHGPRGKKKGRCGLR